MSTVPKNLLTPEGYLARERNADFKSEYFRGETFAMAEASARHNLIVLNTGSVLREQLKKRPFRVYASDLRLKIQSTGLFTYPDLTVVCGDPEFAYDQGDVLLNPDVIVEVLSESTEAYDRGNKFEHYRTIDSLKHYLLVAQERTAIDCFSRRDDDNWVFSSAQDLTDSIQLAAIQCTLPLSEVYEKVELDPDEQALASDL